MKKSIIMKKLFYLVTALFIIIAGCNQRPKEKESKVIVENSIAVLPFRIDSTNDSSAYFINGITEEILSDLILIKDLKVLSRTSVEPYTNTTKSISEIAKELQIRYVVEGSVQKYGKNMSITVQLIDAVNDKHLWSKTYEKEILEADNIFNIQEQIAQDIVTEIKTLITPL